MQEFHFTEMMEALDALGLNETEASVYQASLSSGTRPASIIAKKAGLKRAHTYNILEVLKDRGIVQETIKNSIRHYCPLPPSSLLDMLNTRVCELEHKKKNLESILPKLEQLQSSMVRQAKVRLYQGKDGIREIFEDILRVGEDLHSIVDLQYSWSSVDEESRAWIRDFIKRREAVGMVWRAVAVRSEASDRELRSRSSKQREVKVMEGIKIPAEINIFGDKVALTSTNGEMFGAVVENKTIAETFKNLHAFLWNILPDYEPDEPASCSLKE